jgi:hypothetical protein
MGPLGESGSMSGLPWGKFFWKDWLTDPALSVCSLAAQGLWMRMLCIMSMSEPRGHFILPPPTRQESEAMQVARMFGADARQVSSLLHELERRSVFSREDGIIVCRRMVRDAKRVATGAASARKRWRKGNGPDRPDPMGNPIGPPMGNPSTDTEADTDTDSPPTRPHSRNRHKAASRNGFTDSVTADLETDHAEAADPPSGSATVVPILGRAVRC